MHSERFQSKTAAASACQNIGKIIYADVTCQLSAEEVGGWTPKHIRRRKLAAAVTWSPGESSPRIYFEQGAKAVVTALEQAQVVIGYNCLAFDFEILRGYRSFQPKRVLDIASDLRERTGQQISISSVWKGTFGTKITSSGLDRIEFWQSGQLLRLIQSCFHQVNRIRQIHEYGLQHGRIAYVDRFGQVRRVKVDWAV